MAHKRHFFLWDLLTQVRRCPWCGGIDIHPSRHPLPLLSVFRCETWRCHKCGRRFPLRPGPEPAAPAAVPPQRRRRPAGEELRSLDATLASVLTPGLVDVPDAGEPPKQTAPALEPPPRRRADEQG